MPRRLTRPDPPLSDDAILLEPLRCSLAPAFEWAAAGDPEIVRFTLIPTNPDATFVAEWLGRYENGWLDGTRAGFAIRVAADEAALGFAAIVALDLDKREGEIGYALPLEGRGRGTATRAVSLLTRWDWTSWVSNGWSCASMSGTPRPNESPSAAATGATASSGRCTSKRACAGTSAYGRASRRTDPVGCC